MTRLRRAAQALLWRAVGWLALLWFALLWLGAAAPAQAHRSGESQLDLRIDGDQLQAHWQIAVHDLGRAEPTAATLADLAQARAWLAANVPAKPLPSMDTEAGFGAHQEWEALLSASRWSVVSWPKAFHVPSP